MQSLIFFIASCCFSCAFFVIGVNNPIHSILLLILVFFFGSILLLILNIEFFALIFLIVYVGAIAVLFLFMVMTLDIKIYNINQKLRDFFSYKLIIIFLILINFLVFINQDFIFLFSDNENIIYLNSYLDYSKILKYENHLEVIGKALFSEYLIQFLLCGFILFISMIGAIVVTVDDFNYKLLKQQNPNVQTFRLSDHSVFNFKSYKKKIKKLF